MPGSAKTSPDGGDEQDFSVFLVERRLWPDAGNRFAVIGQHFHDFDKGIGLDAQMVAGKTAVLDRVHDPVQAQANFMQQPRARSS